jgi:hypothetical protein
MLAHNSILKVIAERMETTRQRERKVGLWSLKTLVVLWKREYRSFRNGDQTDSTT